MSEKSDKLSKTKNREKKPPQHRFDHLFGWGMSAPAIIGLLLFLILPFVMAIGLSFTDQRLLSPNPTEFVGLRNYNRLLSLNFLTIPPERNEDGDLQRDDNGEIIYAELRDFTRSDDYPQYRGFQELFVVTAFQNKYYVLAKDPTFLQSVLNNFLYAIGIVPVQSVLALFLAILINQNLPGMRIFRTIYFGPVVISLVVISVLWSLLYQPQGLVNAFLELVTLGIFEPFNWLQNPNTALIAIVIASIWQGVGFQMVIFLAGLQNIPAMLYEAAEVAGATRIERFFDITIPQLRNTIIFVAISTTILAFRLFTQIDVMTSGGPLDSTSSVVFYTVEKGYRENNIGYASAISVVFFVIVLIISLIQRWALGENKRG